MVFDETLKYHVKKPMLKLYETMCFYKFEQLRKEDENEKKDKIEVEIYELINSIQEVIA